jgi:hypothetical protein
LAWLEQLASLASLTSQRIKRMIQAIDMPQEVSGVSEQATDDVIRTRYGLEGGHFVSQSGF